MEVNQISDFQTFLESFDFSSLLDMVLILIASFICITLHELSHGFVAWKLGDNTAKSEGRLTLNPFRHLDIIGLIMMMVFQVGWAKPVPVNMYNFKNPKKGMALVAAAGPLSNIFITVLFLFLYGLLFIPLASLHFGGHILHLFELTAYISLGFAVFNLLPFPPLDGAKMLFSALKDEHYEVLMRYEFYGSIALILLMMTGALGYPIAVVRQLIYNDLMPIAQWACDLVAVLFYM